ncbi:MAG: glycosyltransferase family 39 protein, partial [Anaerolineae bacterium]|nr:glycosyltransferase family 39 protein [Anaerolineae bacterium]
MNEQSGVGAGRSDGWASLRRRIVAGLAPRSLVPALLAAGLLAAAAYLRFSRLGYALMEGDQSVILGIALRFVRGGPLPLAGMKSSAGVMMPPLAEYLLALPLFVRQEVMSAVVFSAALGFLAVAACLWFTARLAGWRAGLIAALLFAVNPWAVHYSRFLWNPNYIPFFSTLLLGSLLLYFAAPGRRGLCLALSLLWLAAVIQLHPTSLVLIVAVGLILLLLWRAVSARHLALGLGLFALSFLPYLLYMKMTGFADLRAMFSALGGERAYLNVASFLHIRDVVTGNGLLESAMEWKAAVWPWHALGRLEGWLLVACTLYAAAHLLVRGRQTLFRREPAALSAAFAMLLLWIIVPGLFYLRHTVYLQNYYFIYVYPAPYVLIGLVIDQVLGHAASLPRRGRGPWRRLAYGAASLLLVGPILGIGLWQFHVSEVRMALQDAGRLHHRQAQELDRLSAAMRRVIDAHPGCDPIVVSGGHTGETSPFGLLADLSSSQVRFVQDGRGLILPEGCATYLDTTSGGWLQSWAQGLVELREEEV